MAEKRKKPRLTAPEVKWLCEVDEHVRRYDYRADSLCQAFSDVHDGGLYPKEVRSLVRQRLLRWIPLSEPDRMGNGLLGDRVTVDFTDRALRIFWPARVLITEAK